ncbi:hypothetical protein [Pseudomonas phage phiZ98]|nr:hypothetical protein [Pseudomonas phage phiZ98]
MPASTSSRLAVRFARTSSPQIRGRLVCVKGFTRLSIDHSSWLVYHVSTI